LSDKGIYFLNFLLGLLGAWVITKFGNKIGILDHPNSRSSHDIPTPKGGGIGIVTAFLFSSLYLGIPLYFWFPLTLLALLTFWNDRHELSPKWRLLAQLILITFLLLTADISINGNRQLPWILFGAVFIVGTANFYNFMDGINGIAGLTGFIGFGLLAIYFHFHQTNSVYFTLTTCICLSCIGFLPLNFPQARVFMGDIGSIFLGTLFGSIVFLAARNFLEFFCLASFLFPFYADELTTMFVRLRNGDNLAQPHRKHFYQLLVNEKNFPHWKVSVGFGLFQLVVGLSVLFVKSHGTIPVFVLLSFFFTAFTAASFYIRSSLEEAKNNYPTQ